MCPSGAGQWGDDDAAAGLVVMVGAQGEFYILFQYTNPSKVWRCCDLRFLPNEPPL